MATIRGTTGADILAGTIDGDYFLINDPGDQINEPAAGGIDWAYSTIASYTLAANVENLVLRDPALNGTGNELNNLVFGNARDNVLEGAAGNDQLYGDAGNDTLSGGADNDYLDGGVGNDRMIGGSGDDVYAVDSYADVVVESAGGGTDKIVSSLSYTLTDGSNVENLSLIDGTAATNATGNAVANVLIGNDKDNIVYGLGGDDTLYGRDGNDSLFGNEGADTLFGGTGSDFLNGGTGADSMEGGDGNDSYVVDDAGDVVNESGTGLDTIYLVNTTNGASFDLGNAGSVENLILKTGNATGVTATGNGLNNTIIGSAADNIIAGAGGNDYLTGGGGNDRFIMSKFDINGTDRITDFSLGDKIVVNTTEYGTTTVYENGFTSASDGPAFVILGTSLVYTTDADGTGTNYVLATTNAYNLKASDLDLIA